MSVTPFLPDGPSPASTEIRPDPVPDPIPDLAKVGVEETIGATDDEVGDRTGPAVGYDQEPVQEKDRGGVS